MNLTDFLLARIDEDEAVARDLLNEFGSTIGSWRAAPAYSPTRTVALHPARVLAECEAKRYIVRQAAVSGERNDSSMAGLVGTVGAQLIVAALADAYADHPDHPEYRQERKP